MYWPGVLFIIAILTTELYGINVNRPLKCHKNYKVCGSNGKTYENICAYSQDKTITDPIILYPGPCRTPQKEYGRPEFVLPPDVYEEDSYDDYNDVPQSGWRKKLIDIMKNLMEYLKRSERKKPKPKLGPPTPPWVIKPLVASPVKLAPKPKK